MEKKCAKCGKPIKEVGRLVKVTWLGFRAPLCAKCRKEIKKKPKSRFSVNSLFRKFRRESTKTSKKKKK
jgi:recombinational DNA repair protein (RecF pathway)